MIDPSNAGLSWGSARYSEQTLHVPCGGGPSLCRGSTFYYHHPYKPPYPLLLIRWEAHVQIACSRLRDSKARGTEKARTRKKKREETGERGRRRKWLQALSPFLFLFPRPVPIFARPTLSRLPHYLRTWNRLKPRWVCYATNANSRHQDWEVNKVNDVVKCS